MAECQFPEAAVNGFLEVVLTEWLEEQKHRQAGRDLRKQYRPPDARPGQISDAGFFDDPADAD